MRSRVRSRGLQGVAIAAWLLAWVGFLGCGAASEAPSFVPLGARPIRPDRAMAARIGRQALEEYGYDEIIRRAVKAHFLRYPDPVKPHADNLVGQTIAEAARQAWPVFTQWAVMAGITSQLDSPAPGPADLVAIGELVVGLYRAGQVATMVLTMSSGNAGSAKTARTTTTTTTATRSKPNQTCDDNRLKELERAKDAVCQAFPGEGCRPTRANAERLPLYPCSVIVARIAAMMACAAARQQVQDECFKNATDAGHAEQIQNFINGITWCESLKATNCAPGHPMSGI